MVFVCCVIESTGNEEGEKLRYKLFQKGEGVGKNIK